MGGVVHITAEQKARDLLERIGVRDPHPQSYSAGDIVELANLIAEVENLRIRDQLRQKMMR